MGTLDLFVTSVLPQMQEAYRVCVASAHFARGGSSLIKPVTYGRVLGLPFLLCCAYGLFPELESMLNMRGSPPNTKRRGLSM
jgi:hypothetical protein